MELQIDNKNKIKFYSSVKPKKGKFDFPKGWKGLVAWKFPKDTIFLEKIFDENNKVIRIIQFDNPQEFSEYFKKHICYINGHLSYILDNFIKKESINNQINSIDSSEYKNFTLSNCNLALLS